MSNQSLALVGKTSELPAPVAERGYSPEQWNTMKNVLFRGASDEAMLLVIDYCKARKLDPLKRPVHIVKVWDSSIRALVETIWPGINELRTTAMRTGSYAGMDEPNLGPMVTNRVGTVDVYFPEYAQVTVYRMVGGQRVPFAGPRVYWLETYAQKKNDDPTPNAMWFKRPRGQLVKCAEAAALRAAFPEELGHEFAAEEMDGQIINERPRHLLDEAGHEPMGLDLIHDAETGEIVDDEPAPTNWKAWSALMAARIDACETAEALAELQTDNAGKLIELARAKQKWADALNERFGTRFHAIEGIEE